MTSVSWCIGMKHKFQSFTQTYNNYCSKIIREILQRSTWYTQYPIDFSEERVCINQNIPIESNQSLNTVNIDADPGSINNTQYREHGMALPLSFGKGMPRINRVMFHFSPSTKLPDTLKPEYHFTAYQLKLITSWFFK